MDILVSKKGETWTAVYSDNKQVRATGKSKAEAVGNLVIQASSIFGIAVLHG